MRILIIGGTGLISAPMTQMLLAQGDDVTHFNRGRLDLYPAPAGVTTVHGDRTDYAAFERQVQDLGLFDCVIDMVGYLPEDAHSTVRAFRGRTGQFLFCSTVDVYRKPAAHYPVTENEEYGGLNTYSRNKVAIEQTLFAAHAAGNFPLTVIRPAYTYGEGRGLLHSFGGRTSYVDRIRRGKPIVVHGDGSSFWTACHKDDVARAFVAATRNPQTIGRAYHTPGEEWLTWDMYHQAVAEALGAPPPQLVHIPTDVLALAAPRHAGICVENFQFNNIFDTSAAHADLGFCYTIPWREGVQRMAAWLDAHGAVEPWDADPYEDRLIAAWQRSGTGLLADLAANGGIE
jgi:nucleoside-diphosphate-sugar epimerase